MACKKSAVQNFTKIPSNLLSEGIVSKFFLLKKNTHNFETICFKNGWVDFKTNKYIFIVFTEIDHAFVDALSRPNSEKAIRLRDFATMLYDYQLFTEDKVNILTSFSAIDDQGVN